MIQHFSFVHKGGFYHYRLNKENLKNVTFESLKEFLLNVKEKCPNDYFNSEPRSSSLKFNIPCKLAKISDYEICDLTKLGLEVNEERFKSGHTKVQVFCLENDKKSLAAEVPVWFEENENNMIKGNLTGHIDLLRYEDGKVWIWDYKPNALNEKYASTQLYFYALMLSERTGINLENIRCGYFDSAYAFTFKPENVKFNKLIS